LISEYLATITDQLSHGFIILMLKLFRKKNPKPTILAMEKPKFDLKFQRLCKFGLFNLLFDRSAIMLLDYYNNWISTGRPRLSGFGLFLV